jgi:mannose-6-phosphate isomerase-like protein (cupin superfamily)
MGFMRIYTDANGETHFDHIEFPREGAEMPANRMMLRYQEAGRLMDWHTVSQRMYYVTLSGEAEVTVSDGETRRVGPGNVTLCEDTAGKGHRTQVVGAGPRLCLAVTLD